jgi:hypothetical protein
MPDHNHNGNYEEGVRDGRLSSLERRADIHDATNNSHERRLQYLERIVYGMMAIVAFTSVLPEVMEVLRAFSQ